MADADALSWGLAQAAGSLDRNLANALMTGALEVRQDGQMVRYRDVSEMMAILAARYRATLSTSSQRPQVTYARFSRGW